MPASMDLNHGFSAVSPGPTPLILAHLDSANKHQLLRGSGDMGLLQQLFGDQNRQIVGSSKPAKATK